MGVVPFGHQSVIRYVQESTVGTFPTNPALLLFSKEVQRVRIFIDRERKESLDIGTVDVVEYFAAKKVYGMEIEFHVYDIDRFGDFQERNADGSPKAWSLEFIPDNGASTKHYYRGTGWRCTSAKMRGKTGDAWMATLVLAGGKWSDPVTVDPGIGTGSREDASAIVDALRTFAGGVITIDGSAAAVLVEEFEMNFEHGVEAHWTAGAEDPVVTAATYKARRITGTLNMSLDDGFKEHWDRVIGSSAATIVVPFGSTGQPKITFTGVRFPRLEAEAAVDVGVYMGNVPFVATTYAEGTV
jgi:hypothetical protein